MHFNQNIPVRFPKGIFAMWSVYSFTGAAILASIVFSLLLFLSIDDDPLMKFLFGGLAVIFELGKFFAWYEVGERKARRNYSGTFTAFTFYAVLAAISIGGSVGGINSATNKAHSEANVQLSKINAFNMQIQAIEKQIDLNNIAAEKYIQMERIASGVTRIQKENEVLRKQQQQIAIERDTTPVVGQGSVLGLIDSLAATFNVSNQSAQLGLVIFLSVLLDFFAAFFVGLIGEENRFRYQFKRQQHLAVNGYNSHDQSPLLSHFDPSTVGTSSITTLNDDEIIVEDVEPIAPKTAYEQAVEALTKNQVNCSKRAVSKLLKLTADEVDTIFHQLLDQGIVSKKPNNHYQWHGIQTLVS